MRPAFRRTAGAALAFGLAASLSHAADLSTAYQAPVAAPATFSWTGCYAGANLGYGWARASGSTTVAGIAAGSGSENLNGVVGGGQLGCNYQTGRIVWGAEGDFSGSAQSKKTTQSALGLTATTTDKIPWFATARARVGYAADQWLFYGTGGWGYAEFKSDTAFSGLLVATMSAKANRSGWTAGGGVENAFAPHWSWKFEYLHLDFGQFTATANVVGIPVATTVKASDNLVRAGLNYRF